MSINPDASRSHIGEVPNVMWIGVMWRRICNQRPIWLSVNLDEYH